MNLIRKSIIALSFITLFASCSKDGEFMNEEQETIEITADLVVVDQFAADILEAVNTHRASIGKTALSANSDSKTQAVEHSKYMASKKEISHDNFFQRSDYLKAKGAGRVSENVAFGYRSAQEVVDAWIASPSHKKAMEGDFTHSGIAVVKTEKGIAYFTQIFITK